mmetsp:Transcript_7721/g.11379  ORF Transcript_7721/g.11379 Transcript_7721/m.11379 type:complete len:220 (-) Transcript_7721:76-735(-)
MQNKEKKCCGCLAFLFCKKKNSQNNPQESNSNIASQNSQGSRVSRKVNPETVFKCSGSTNPSSPQDKNLAASAQTFRARSTIVTGSEPLHASSPMKFPTQGLRKKPLSDIINHEVTLPHNLSISLSTIKSEKSREVSDGSSFASGLTFDEKNKESEDAPNHPAVEVPKVFDNFKTNNKKLPQLKPTTPSHNTRRKSQQFTKASTHFVLEDLRKELEQEF